MTHELRDFLWSLTGAQEGLFHASADLPRAKTRNVDAPRRAQRSRRSPGSGAGLLPRRGPGAAAEREPPCRLRGCSGTRRCRRGALGVPRGFTLWVAGTLTHRTAPPRGRTEPGRAGRLWGPEPPLPSGAARHRRSRPRTPSPPGHGGPGAVPEHGGKRERRGGSARTGAPPVRTHGGKREPHEGPHCRGQPRRSGERQPRGGSALAEGRSPERGPHSPRPRAPSAAPGPAPPGASLPAT